MLPVVVIGGPTASGKSALALALAQKYAGAVINADSLQLYTDLPILTAQPDADDRAAAPHFLYGQATADDRYTAQRWRDAALSTIDTCHAAGQLPIIVGGTGFYLNALLEGLSVLPLIPPAARDAAQKIYDAEGVSGLYTRLAAADPTGAARLDQHNPQRLMRAYEVLLHTGKPISYWQAQPRQGPPPHLRFLTIRLDPPRDDILRNCHSRAGKMLAAGALAEAADFSRRIKNGHVPADTPLVHACGFAALIDRLADKISDQHMMEALLIDTRQYARRQSTWFRNQWQPDITVTRWDDPASHQAVDAFIKEKITA